jgi:hypothetical protein
MRERKRFESDPDAGIFFGVCEFCGYETARLTSAPVEGPDGTRCPKCACPKPQPRGAWYRCQSCGVEVYGRDRPDGRVYAKLPAEVPPSRPETLRAALCHACGELDEADAGRRVGR